MKLLAISGGIDSMVLAHMYRDDPEIILVHVNYNFRSDSHIDQKLVENFAQKYHKQLEILVLDGTKPKGNLQNWARQQRYQFFSQIYKQYDCSALIVAHHQDDNLETCLMQNQKNPLKLFYGIKPTQQLFGMQIERPLIAKNYWKKQLYVYGRYHRIAFHEDSTNQSDLYERNKLRNQQLKSLSLRQKSTLLNLFAKLNQAKEQLLKQIESDFVLWQENAFSTKIWTQLPTQNYLIPKFINHFAKQINLNQAIIKNIGAFIKANQTNKKFLLNNNYFLSKTNHQLQMGKV